MAVIRRLTLAALVLLALHLLAFGGEYSWFDLRTVRSAAKEEERKLTDSQGRLDSLSLLRDSLEYDPAALERVARERYGLLRPGEVLYRFVEPRDSS